MTGKRSVYDVIPTRDLDKMCRLQEEAVELENQAFILQARAQEIRTKAEDIVTAYRIRMEKRGWGACRAEAEAENMRSWYCDPLPGQRVQA
ncbi:MAG: hypothetical protein A4E37_00014 [Methanoregulaceae archaeon PtaB.Bin056]|jgi:hypothetical protein|nr:MAG: hypothetical protein A4E37_00014 [Methanoregulaceae archaeon PtaB.Bin056]OPY42756.1 MAG: hypothetical protein A4E41_00136 [Methanoregulaceae archaeon PtaU1.Bin066]HII75931.1 hypothetical protein [Methanolinea sp.]